MEVLRKNKMLAITPLVLMGVLALTIFVFQTNAFADYCGQQQGNTCQTYDNCGLWGIRCSGGGNTLCGGDGDFDNSTGQPCAVEYVGVVWVCIIPNGGCGGQRAMGC